MNKILAAAAFAVLAASGANATVIQVGSVSDAKTIVISSAIPSYLQVAEVIALNNGGVDVAAASKGATATATSQYSVSVGWPNNDGPDKAIDGNTDGSYKGPGYSGTDGIYHSANASAAEALTITFAGTEDLSSLTIYGRTDCCTNRDVYNVTILDASGGTLFTGTLDETSQLSSFAFAAVPELATWTMLILGFGMVGFAMRVRREGVAAAA